MIDNRTQKRRVKDFWYSWHPADYAVKTAHLTAVQDGIYRRLLDHYYLQHGRVVANATILLRVCRAFDAAEVAAVHDMLAEFFTVQDGYYHHERADHELEKRALLREKRAQAGSKGGKQKVANATNLLGSLLTTTTTTTTIKEEGTVPAQKPPVAIATNGAAPDGAEAPPSFGKRPRKKKPSGIEPGIPTDDVGAIVDYWNGLAEHVGLPQVRMVTATRRQKVQARINELGGVVNLGSVIDKIEHQPFLLGRNKRNWHATFDWVMEPSNLAKVAENTYANTGGVNGHA